MPVIEKDVDGSYPRSLALDHKNPNLGWYSVCRRVARMVFLGSGSTQRATNRGIDDRQVRLGRLRTGESRGLCWKRLAAARRNGRNDSVGIALLMPCAYTENERSKVFFGGFGFVLGS